MASVKSSIRPFNSCIRCIRQAANTNSLLNGSSIRLFSSSTATREEAQVQPPAQPNSMEKWGPLDPNLVDNKRDERRLLRRDGIQPIGSRRRRAALQTSALIPFDQLPYQCFQEARKILFEDRQEKLKQIQKQKSRLQNLVTQDPAVSGGVKAKEARIRSMRNHLNELIILADINDPMVKKKFEDGEGDMNKSIYRYLADRKWRQYKRLILEQRIKQLNIVPDILPALDPIADVDLAFGRRKIAPGEFVDSCISESIPRLKVQTFEPGEKLVTVVVVDADVPVPEKDGFTYRCHFIANNIPISATQTSIALNSLDHQPKDVKEPTPFHISSPWLPPWAHKGAPYHRLAVFVLEQLDARVLDVTQVGKTKRMDFILRSFIDKNKLKPIGVTLFRTRWDEHMAAVMQRAGFGDQVNIEFKRKRIEPLPYKRRTERMR
ncbi:PEBP-like protein [Lindgomyces ingoldianus]|uniref:PEBP-like protein n=1 Tax=Lindgomyces ingoldianus TaxID=673940 RepID=A0ACB6R9R8_9PLEO|nr:PEBP-like protein [Lindgomyces ingoldianus]KAF2475072.1 PEBP-like protein [Lindgomyces ingoldianus]